MIGDITVAVAWYKIYAMLTKETGFLKIIFRSGLAMPIYILKSLENS